MTAKHSTYKAIAHYGSAMSLVEGDFRQGKEASIKCRFDRPIQLFIRNLLMIIDGLPH